MQLENDRVEDIIRMTKIEMQMNDIEYREEMSRRQETDRIMQESDEILKRRERVRKRDEERNQYKETTFPNEG